MPRASAASSSARAAADEAVRTFRRWGLTTLGEIAALPADEVRARMGAVPVRSPEKAGEAARQLREYLAGRRTRFTLPLDLRWMSDFQREVLLAEAYRNAQTMKGEGDAKAAAIYAQAYGKNPDEIGAAAYRPNEAAAYVEVHIEQGPILEAEDSPGPLQALAPAGPGVDEHGSGLRQGEGHDEAGHPAA